MTVVLARIDAGNRRGTKAEKRKRDEDRPRKGKYDDREFQKILEDYVRDCTTVTSPWALFLP